MSRTRRPRTSVRASLVATALGALVLAGCGGAETTPEEASEGTAAAPADPTGSDEAAPVDASLALVVVGTDSLRFEPADLVVPAGEEVTLELTSEQVVEHDLVVVGAADLGTVIEVDEGHDHEHGTAADLGEDDLHIAHANAGETVTATFRIDEPGTYEIYCSIPGHRVSGMTGTLTVTEAA